jgi:hypothetical protein
VLRGERQIRPLPLQGGDLETAAAQRLQVVAEAALPALGAQLELLLAVGDQPADELFIKSASSPMALSICRVIQPQSGLL